MAGTQLSRPASGVAVTVLMGVVTAVTVASLVATGDADSARRIVPGFVAATYLTWWLFWWPALIVRPDDLVVRNPLRTFEIGWRAIASVDTRFSTVVRTSSRAIGAWAGPTARRRPGLGTRGAASEPAPEIVARIREDAAVAREDPTTAVPDVVVRWNVAPIVAAIAVVVAAVVLAAV